MKNSIDIKYQAKFWIQVPSPKGEIWLINGKGKYYSSHEAICSHNNLAKSVINFTSRVDI